MVNTDHAQFTQNSSPRQGQRANVPQPPRGVWQDKSATPRERIATRQPASSEKPMRTQQMSTQRDRSQNKTVPKRKTVCISLWVKPVVKRELQRIAAAEKLSISVTGATFLEKSLSQHLDSEHAGLIQPVIEKAIKKEMRAYSTRLAVLLVRVAFASEQTRSIVTNILGRQPGITPDALNTILDGSSKAAKGKITYKTPQLADIITEVEQWFAEQEREGTG